MNDIAKLAGETGFFMPGRNGRTVLLIHGLTGAPNEMRFVGKKLNAQGFTVLCPLLVGHGSDEAELLKTRWRDWYNGLEAVVLKLRQVTPQFYAAGICVGGMLALNLAYHHPETIVGVALYSATLKYDGWNIPGGRIFFPLLRFLGHFPILRGMSFAESAPFGIKDDRLRDRVLKSDALKHCLPHFPLPTLSEMYRFNTLMKKRFSAITTPTLLIHAREDDVSSVDNSHYIAKRLGGYKRVEILEDSYHMIHVDRERHLVAERTAQFFDDFPLPQMSSAA